MTSKEDIDQVYLYCIFICFAILFFLSPLLFLFFTSFYCVFLSKAPHNFWGSFFPALYIGIIASIIDYNGFIVGDVNRYYEYFDIGSQVDDFSQSLVRFKLFQWLSFTLLNEFGFSVRLYTLFSVFIALTLFLCTFFNVIKFFDIKRTLIRNFLYFLLAVTLIPFDVIYSFEYITAVSILFFSYVYFYKSKIGVFLGSVISLSIHNGVLLPLCILLSLFLFKAKYKRLVISLVFYVSFFILFFYGAATSPSSFLSYSAYKFYSYYSDFTFDFSILFVAFIYLFSFYVLSDFYKDKLFNVCSKELLLIDFIRVILNISPLLILNSVFAQRFIVFIAPAFLVLYYRYFIYAKNTTLKVLCFSLLVLTNLSYANILVVNSLIKYVHVGEYSGAFLVTNIKELIEYYE
ncbi:hypothetical protein ACET64_02440 [Aeromonas veronii]